MSHIINVDAIVPALSLQQCVRISSNQWLTDEVTMNTYIQCTYQYAQL